MHITHEYKQFKVNIFNIFWWTFCFSTAHNQKLIWLLSSVLKDINCELYHFVFLQWVHIS
jgi:hypothetical protein